MNKDRYERNDRSSRRTFGSKSLVLVLTCVLLIGSAIGGTIAWLTADAGEVVNTFTESDIDITFSETLPDGQTAQMVPGCTIAKNPTVKVEEGSEDCWLFVKITESTSPALDDYIAYAVALGEADAIESYILNNPKYRNLVYRKTQVSDDPIKRVLY